MSKSILAVLVALMLSGGIAHADADDDDFLRALHQKGIKDTGGDRAMIKLGHMICEPRCSTASQRLRLTSTASRQTFSVESTSTRAKAARRSGQ